MSAIDPAQLELARFHVYRSVAIQEYARLESALHQVLTTTLKCPPAQSAAILYRITNTRSRNQIVEACIREACGDQYAAYWHGIPGTPNRSGLMSIISDIDTRRNEIAHWVVRHTIEVNVMTGEQKFHIYLDRAENWFSPKQTSPGRFIEDLIDFHKKCRFSYLSVGIFANHISSGICGPELQEWLDIFQKPCVYPPLDSHPLAQIYTKPQTPPLAF